MSEVKRGAIIAYAAVAFNALAGLFYTPWMISCIGSDDYGLYTLAISVINFFLIDFGLGEAVSRFLSKFLAEGREDDAATFLGIVYKLYCIIALIILVVLIVIYTFIEVLYQGLSSAQLATFKLLYAIVAAYSVVSFPFLSLDGILISHEKFVALNACTLLQKMMTVGLIVVCLLCGLGVVSLVLVNALTVVFFILAKLIVIVKSTNTSVRFSVSDAALIREVVNFSGWTTVVHLCGRLIFSIMPSILAAVSTTWEVALFGLASSLEGYVYQVANALGNMFMPQVSQLVSSEASSVKLQRLAERIGRIQVVIIGALLVGFVAVGQDFVACWVGTDYCMLYGCVILLIIPSLLELPQVVANTAITAVGAMRQKAYVYGAMALINIAFGITLSGRLGALGASLSICVAYLVRTFGMDVLYRRILGFRVCALLKELFGRWVPFAAVSVLVSLAFRMLVSIGGWLGLAIEVAFTAAFYLVVMWAAYLKDEEKKMVRAAFIPVGHR